MVEFGRPDKTRPVLVLTRTRAAAVLNAVMVAPITTTIRGNRAEIPVGVAEGLKVPSAAKLDAIQTIEQGRLGRLLGSLAPARASEVRAAVLFAMQLESDEDFEA